MSDPNETFFTSIGCMDGRCQEAVTLYGQERFGAQYPDTITEPGMVGILTKKPVDKDLLQGVKDKIDISLKIHHSEGILVYGHQDCAALSAVDDEKHKQDVLAAVEVIRMLIDNPLISIVSLFVERNFENDFSDWVALEIPLP